MNKFVRNLITEWRKINLPFAGETVLIAVSGGADSLSLASALAELRDLKKLRNRFAIAHFNHKLRGAESDADENFVKHFAEKLNFEFYAGAPGKTLSESKANLEQAARNARYKFLENVARQTNVRFILTAHTKNDQAETFLLNLLRGSGLAGLSAMPVVRNSTFSESSESSSSNSELRLVRPLLNNTKREDTEAFCRLKNIDFRQDEMNRNLNFSRVRIRLELLPFLQTFNPKITDTLAGTAELLREECEARNIIPETTQEYLSVKELSKMPKAIRAGIIRSWLKHRRGGLRRLGKIHYDSIENLVSSPKSGRFVELPGGGKIVKRGGKIYFEKSKVEKSPCAN